MPKTTLLSLTPSVILNTECISSAAERPHYSNDTYVSNNLAVVHVYFKSLHFMRQERAELFGIVDFFSNVGGLLGLCMGVRDAIQ